MGNQVRGISMSLPTISLAQIQSWSCGCLIFVLTTIVGLTACTLSTQTAQSCYEVSSSRSNPSKGSCVFEGYLISSAGVQFIARSDNLAELDGCAGNQCLMVSATSSLKFEQAIHEEGCKPARIAGEASFSVEPGVAPYGDWVFIDTIRPEPSPELQSCTALRSSPTELKWP